MRPQPEPAVLAWADGLVPAEVGITAMNEAEILHGLIRLPGGRRKRALLDRWQVLVTNLLGDHVCALCRGTTQCQAHVELLAGVQFWELVDAGSGELEVLEKVASHDPVPRTPRFTRRPKVPEAQISAMALASTPAEQGSYLMIRSGAACCLQTARGPGVLLPLADSNQKGHGPG